MNVFQKLQLEKTLAENPKWFISGQQITEEQVPTFSVNCRSRGRP